MTTAHAATRRHLTEDAAISAAVRALLADRAESVTDLAYHSRISGGRWTGRRDPLRCAVMRTAAVLLLTVVAVAGCSSGVEERPGSPAVYERIGSMSDCGELQREFDTAEAHGGEAGTAYMKAADERMREVGCY